MPKTSALTPNGLPNLPCLKPDEYLKARFALHLLEAMFQPSDSGKSFIFNMSVGYNLEGIKQPPMQQFIDNMMDASDHPKFAQYRDTLNKLLEG